MREASVKIRVFHCVVHCRAFVLVSLRLEGFSPTVDIFADQSRKHGESRIDRAVLFVRVDDIAVVLAGPINQITVIRQPPNPDALLHEIPGDRLLITERVISLPDRETPITYSYDPPTVSQVFPLVVGNTWDWEGTLTVTGGEGPPAIVPTRSTARVVAQESLQTQLGVREAFRVEIELIQVRDGEEHLSTINAWYSNSSFDLELRRITQGPDRRETWELDSIVPRDDVP